jgi:ribosomal protein S18 acetylase RimI-like enzyme
MDAGFAVERLAFEMARDDPELAAPEVPPGYRLEPVRPGDDEDIRAYAEVRNRNFREVLGSLPIGEGTVRAGMEDPGIPPGGLALLRGPDGSPCGTMRAERDVEPGCLSIGALSVDREHRGRGLGRFLLRSAAALGRREGFRTLSLSVNALNKNALGLYESEGFTVRGAWVCLSAPVPTVLARTGSGAGRG